jgi:hypothetical protein
VKLTDAKHLLTRPGVKVMGHRMDFPPMDLPVFVSVPIAVKSPNGGWGNQRGKAFAAKRQRGVVSSALEARYGNRAPKPPLVVTLTRRIPKRGQNLDDDNLAFAFKHVRDGVADWLGTGDAPGCGITWKYEQVRDPESTMGTVGIEIDKGGAT